MDETSMIERVARAMLAAHDHTTNDGAAGGFETMAPDWQEVYRAMARASIEAMREPTEAMLSAGDLPGWDDSVSVGLSGEVWAAMIDTALSPAIGNKDGEQR